MKKLEIQSKETQELLQLIKIVIANAIHTHGVMAIISVAIAEAKPNYLDQVKPLDFFAISLAAPFVLVAMFNDRIQQWILMEICAFIPSRLAQLLPEINALIMAGEVMEEMVEIMEMEIFHTVAIQAAILDQIKGGQVGPPTLIKDGQVGRLTQIKAGQVGPPTQIIGQEGLPAIDLVGLHLAIDPVVHPTIDPVIVLV